MIMNQTGKKSVSSDVPIQLFQLLLEDSSSSDDFIMFPTGLLRISSRWKINTKAAKQPQWQSSVFLLVMAVYGTNRI